MPSKWLHWQPNVRIIEKPGQSEPTKPSKPSSVGFEGSRSRGFSIKREPSVQTLPRGLRLVRYEPKQPPICIESYAVVSDVEKFIEAELRELDARLHNPIQIRAGWGIFTILDWLRQCGVELEIVWPEPLTSPEQPQDDFGKSALNGDAK